MGALATVGVVAGAGLLGGCSSSQTSQEKPSQDEVTSEPKSEPEPTASEDAKPSDSAQESSDALVAVFSWSGNTLAVSDRIAEDLKVERFRIEPTTPYTDDYDEMLQIAQDAQSAGTLPELAGTVPDWDKYSTLYLGFPTWWGHLPQIVKSFLAAHDCKGKVIYPFNTHGGSGFASCLSDLAESCPEADIREGLSIPGDSVSASMDQVDAWVSASE